MAAIPYLLYQAPSPYNIRELHPNTIEQLNEMLCNNLISVLSNLVHISNTLT